MDIMLLLFLKLIGPDAQYKVGDDVIVIHDTQIVLGQKVVHEVGRGTSLNIEAVKGEWLWVSNEGTGWINKRNVTTPDHAVEVFTEQIKRNPQDPKSFLCRGAAWSDMGQEDNALGDFTEAILLNPMSSKAFTFRACCWAKKEEVDNAIADYNESVRLDPTDAMVYNNRGILWLQKSEIDQAVSDATEAIRLQPKFAAAYYNRGRAFSKMKDYDRALSDFAEAVEINPLDSVALGSRGACWAKKGEYDKAISDLDKAIKMNPKNSFDHQCRGWCWALKGEYEKAISDLTLAIQYDPKDFKALNIIARLYATCPDEKYRNGQKAVEFGTKACELTHWKQGWSIDTLAAAYAEIGDFKKATEWQTKLANLAPETQKPEFQARLDLYKLRKPYREQPKR